MGSQVETLLPDNGHGPCEDCVADPTLCQLARDWVRQLVAGRWAA